MGEQQALGGAGPARARGPTPSQGCRAAPGRAGRRYWRACSAAWVLAGICSSERVDLI